MAGQRTVLDDALFAVGSFLAKSANLSEKGLAEMEVATTYSNVW